MQNCLKKKRILHGDAFMETQVISAGSRNLGISAAVSKSFQISPQRQTALNAGGKNIWAEISISSCLPRIAISFFCTGQIHNLAAASDDLCRPHCLFAVVILMGG